MYYVLEFFWPKAGRWCVPGKLKDYTFTSIEDAEEARDDIEESDPDMWSGTSWRVREIFSNGVTKEIRAL